MFPASHGFVAMPVTSFIKDIVHVPIYPYLVCEGDEIVRPCDRHSNETVTLRKDIAKYKNMRKWIVEFLRKFENHSVMVRCEISNKLPIILMMFRENITIYI